MPRLLPEPKYDLLSLSDSFFIDMEVLALGARGFILGIPEPLPLVELFWPIFEYYTPLN